MVCILSRELDMFNGVCFGQREQEQAQRGVASSYIYVRIDKFFGES